MAVGVIVFPVTDAQGNRSEAGVCVHADPAAPAPIADQGYSLVFEDDFDTLDPGVWVPQPWYETSTLPGTFTAQDSMLKIRARQENGYARTELTSLGPRAPAYPHRPSGRSFQEGYFEARLRFTDDPWSWPAFWLLSQESGNLEGGEPRNCNLLNSEWDLMEHGIGGAPADTEHVSVLHRNTNGICGQPDQGRNYQVAGNNLSGWHVWGGKWTAGQVCTYLDGVELGCQPTFDSTAQPMYLIFDIYVLGLCGFCDTPRLPEYEMQVDWVRVWQKET
jgi:beta-glucanase (GH16 family)